MTSRKLIPSILVILLSSLFVGADPAAADSSHARIIRLSLVQGDVRFARETHGDPLADSKAGAVSALIITTTAALSKLLRAAFPFCTRRTPRGLKRASPFR